MLGTVIFVDVGQGDCTLAINRETHEAILIDCPNSGTRAVHEAMRQFEVEKITSAVVTHLDFDHMGGVFTTISNQWELRELRCNLDTIVSTDKREKIKLKSALRAYYGFEDRGVNVTSAYEGDVILAGDISCQILAPTHAQLMLGQAIGSRNFSSVIAKITVNKHSILIAGDANGESWSHVFKRGQDVRSDVLRVSHHGASHVESATHAKFEDVLKAVGARTFVISVGTTNGYGHPDRGTISALRDLGNTERILCTEVNRTCLGDRSLPIREAQRLSGHSLNEIGYRPKACPCAGSIVIHCSDDGVIVLPSSSEHQRVMDSLASPMCKR